MSCQFWSHIIGRLCGQQASHTHTFNDRRDKGNKISTTTVEFFAAGLQSLITANKKERKKEKREKSQTYLATDASQETATMKKENNNHKDFRTK